MCMLVCVSVCVYRCVGLKVPVLTKHTHTEQEAETDSCQAVYEPDVKLEWQLLLWGLQPSSNNV